MSNRLKDVALVAARASDPRVIIRDCRANPSVSKDVRQWISKRVQVMYTTVPGTVVSCFPSNFISVTAVSGVSNTTPFSSVYGSSTPFKVVGVKVWNLSLGYPIKSDLDADVLTVGNSSQSMVASDAGTGSNLAGVRYIIPSVLAQTLTMGDGTSVMLSVSMPGVTTSSLAQFRFLVEYSLLIQT